MKVINFLAEPSAGKSTTAAGLFWLMKHAGLRVELVTEFAKECVWDEHKLMFKDQIAMLGEQNHRLERLREGNKVDFAITDSPVFLSIVYPAIYGTAPYKNFAPFVKQLFDSYDNYNILLKRIKPYRTEGRNESKSQAERISDKVKELIGKYGIEHICEDGDLVAPFRILRGMKHRFGLKLDLPPIATISLDGLTNCE